MVKLLLRFICVYMCDYSSHQESQNSGLSSRLTAVQEDMGKSPARKRCLLFTLVKVIFVHSALIFIDYKYNILFDVLRSASVTNLSLDRSGSSMVPAYESSVSPQNSRALSKIDHSEEERKILLVATVFYRFLLNFTSLSSCYNSWLSCRILLNLRIYGRKFATTVQEWSSRTTGTGCALTPTALWVRSWSTGSYEMALFQLGKNQYNWFWQLYFRFITTSRMVRCLVVCYYIFIKCFISSWFFRHRAQAIAIGQALVDGRWLDCVTHHDQIFRDEYALYRPLQVRRSVLWQVYIWTVV